MTYRTVETTAAEYKVTDTGEKWQRPMRAVGNNSEPEFTVGKY